MIAVHSELNENAGASGVTLRLADVYERAGHTTKVFSFSNLDHRLGELTKSIIFPHFLFWALKHHGPFDVVDVASGDAWVLAHNRRRDARPLVVTRSHGLEHRMHLQTVESATAGRIELSWKYPVYHGGFRLWEVTKSMRSSDVNFFLSEEDRFFATRELGIAEGKTRVVRNGLPARLLGLRAPQSYSGAINIAVVGTYLERKGIVFSAKALTSLLGAHPDWSATFLGTGTPVGEVLASYPLSVHNQITVIPSYKNDDLPRLLEDHQIHLFPTLFEGGPSLALLETMALGLAPVVSDLPGTRGVIQNGENGFLVAPTDSDGLIRSVEHLGQNRELLHSVRVAAQVTAQSYGWDEAGQAQLGIYTDLLSQRGRAMQKQVF